jgi:DNA-binding MarR family transcriptional regulator
MNPGKLLILLNGTCRLFIQNANKILSESGCPVGYLQFVTLKAIADVDPNSPSSIKKIADSIGVERSTLSHNSDALEKYGYVTKSPKRPAITVLSLTDAGRAVVDGWTKMYEDLTEKAVNGVSQKLKEDLERIGRNLL